MRALVASLIGVFTLTISLASSAMAQPEQSVAVDVPWASSIVDIESLPGGGFIVVAKGTPGVLWSFDGMGWQDADPQRSIGSYEAMSIDPPPEEALIATVGDRILVLDRSNTGVWSGDPESGIWESVNLDSDDFVGGAELITIAGSDTEALVVGKVSTEASPGGDAETHGAHEYVVWLIDPTDGSTVRHPLPIPGTDYWYAFAAWFDGRWLVAITDSGTGSLLSSADAASWIVHEWPAGWGSLTSMSVGPSSMFVTTCHFGGDSFWYSPDGRQWARTTSAFAGHDSVYVEGLGFVVPYGDTILVSPDGRLVGRLGPNLAGGAEHVAASADRLLIASGADLVLTPGLAELSAVEFGAAIEYAPPPSIDPSLVPDADGFIFEEVVPGVRRLVTDGAGHFPSATYIREARDMDELAIDEEGRVLVWSTTHGIDNELGGDSQLWVLGVDGVLDPDEGPPRPWEAAGAWGDPAIQLAPDGRVWMLGWDDGSGVIRSDGETDQRFLADRFLNSLAITPDGRVWVAEGHDPGEAGGIYVIEPDAVGDPVEPPSVQPTDEEVFQPGPVTTDILPGVALNVEEVEPGVLWVRNDGVSVFAYPVDWEVPYDIVAGHDGGIYVLEPGHYARLGEGGGSAEGPKGFDWDLEDAFPSDVEVAPDGTVWAVFGKRLYSTPWGSGHETRHLPTMVGPEPIEVTSDGTVWTVWRDDSGSVVFGYLGADGWTVVGEWPFDGGYLRVSDRGEVWAGDHVGWGFFGVHRFVDGAWREEEGSPNGAFDRTDADVGVDGTFWGIRDGHYGGHIGNDLLIRFDGTEWTTFQPPDWSRTDVAMRGLAEDGDGWVPPDFRRSQWGEPHVASDGALWVPQRLGVMERDADLGGGHQVVCSDGVDGVARFDGETWSRFLQGRCVEAMDIAADGSVWMLASKSDARFPLAHVYVITPEAVAATG